MKNSFSRAITSTILALAVAAIALPAADSAYAATGSNLRTISGAYSQGSCSINTGLAFDGTNLLVSCWSYNVIDVLSPSDGSLVTSKAITGYSGFGALAWDATRQKMWACDSSNENVVLIDMVTGTGETKFPTTGCIDGLAYDGTDDTLWASEDVASTLYHYSINGAVLGTFNLSGKLVGGGNSGIAVGGPTLFLANNGGQQIYQGPKDLSSLTLFASFPERLEDLECDSVTFTGQGVGAIWSIDAFDRTLNAWEIPQGICGSGGIGDGAGFSNEIPTMSEWMLVLMASLLALSAVFVRRRRPR